MHLLFFCVQLKIYIWDDMRVTIPLTKSLLAIRLDCWFIYCFTCPLSCVSRWGIFIFVYLVIFLHKYLCFFLRLCSRHMEISRVLCMVCSSTPPMSLKTSCSLNASRPRASAPPTSTTFQRCFVRYLPKISILAMGIFRVCTV